MSDKFKLVLRALRIALLNENLLLLLTMLRLMQLEPSKEYSFIETIGVGYAFIKFVMDLKKINQLHIK